MSRWRARALVFAAFCLAAALRGEHGRAADPQPYQVTIAPTGDAALDAAARATADPGRPARHRAGRAVRADRPGARRPRPSHHRARQRSATTRAASPSPSPAMPLDDPGLASLLDATPSGTSVPVAVTLTPGPLFHLRQLVLPPGTPAVAEAVLGLRPGESGAGRRRAGGARPHAACAARRRLRARQGGRAGRHAGAGGGRARRQLPDRGRSAGQPRADRHHRREDAERELPPPPAPARARAALRPGRAGPGAAGPRAGAGDRLGAHRSGRPRSMRMAGCRSRCR